MDEIKGLTAAVTGAGGGIGRAICVSLAKEGVNVALLGGNNTERLAETEREVRAAGGRALVIPGNLSKAEVMVAGLKAAEKEFGGIDILINNAGKAFNAPFEETPEEVFDALMEINVKVPFMLTQKALPYLKKSARASIINICSVVSKAGYPYQSAYTASKHALLGFTKSLAAELFKEGIRVQAVCPGGVYTDMVKVARPDLPPDGMIMPEEIADIVLFLLKSRGNAVIDEIGVHRVNKQPFLV